MKQIFIIFIFIISISITISCNHKKQLPQKSSLKIVEVLKKLDKEYCFENAVRISYYDNWRDFLSGCYDEKNIEKRNSCLKIPRIIYRDRVPEKILANRKFIFLFNWENYICPPKTVCINDTEKILVLDPKTYEVIETNASKRYRKSCLKSKENK